MSGIVNEVFTNKDLDKLTTAGKLCGELMVTVLGRCVSGSEIKSLCKNGDDEGRLLCTKVYQKKEEGKPVIKGLAMPVCVNVNEIGSNYRLFSDDTDTTGVGVGQTAEAGNISEIPYKSIKAGDLVTVEGGIQVDGYGCYGAMSTLAMPSCGCKDDSSCPECKDIVMDVKAFEALALSYAVSSVVRSKIEVGITSKEITALIQELMESTSLKASTCSNSREYKRFVYQGANRIGARTDVKEETEMVPWGVKENQTIVIDIAVSTGEGKSKAAPIKTNLYRRAAENKYILKSELARAFVGIVDSTYPSFPFSLNYIEDASTAKRGVAESLRHGLIVPLPPSTEKKGEFIARTAFSIAILPSKKTKPLNPPKFPFDFINQLPNHLKKQLPALHSIFTQPKLKAVYAHTENK